MFGVLGLFTTLALIPLLIVSLVAGIWRWAWRRFRIHRFRRSIPIGEDFPEDDAYRTLARIAAMDLPGLGVYHQHYAMVLDCLQAYFEAIYALDGTTFDAEQWLAYLREQGVDETVMILLRDVFSQAELAQESPPPIQPVTARHVIHTARHIVDVTKPVR